MVRTVMTVDAIKDFGRHAEVSRSLPNGHAALHEPRRGGVAQRVGNDFAPFSRQPRKSRGMCEGGLDRQNRLALEFDEVLPTKPRRRQRRMCANKRGGIGAGGWRLFVARLPWARR